jgi:hypothetical protein
VFSHALSEAYVVTFTTQFPLIINFMRSRPLVLQPVPDWPFALDTLKNHFPEISCYPSRNILPENPFEQKVVIECLENREFHTAFLVAWIICRDGFPVYLIHLFEKRNNNTHFRCRFEGINKYYEYCSKNLKDPVLMDLAGHLQYEYIL